MAYEMRVGLYLKREEMQRLISWAYRNGIRIPRENERKAWTEHEERELVRTIVKEMVRRTIRDERERVDDEVWERLRGRRA